MAIIHNEARNYRFDNEDLPRLIREAARDPKGTLAEHRGSLARQEAADASLMEEALKPVSGRTPRSERDAAAAAAINPARFWAEREKRAG
jgi:hypothetical protein